MTDHLQNLFQKELSRKEFLGVIGLAALSVFGAGRIVKLLTGKSIDTHPLLKRDQGNGGSGSYAGAQNV